MTESQKAVELDGELERGEHPIGKTVHLSTVTHAWRGKLLTVTPSYYMLEEGAVMVGNTGDIGAYDLSNGEEQSEPVKFEVRVLRAAVSWMASE